VNTHCADDLANTKEEETVKKNQFLFSVVLCFLGSHVFVFACVRVCVLFVFIENSVFGIL